MNVIFLCLRNESTANFTSKTETKVKTSTLKVPFPVKIASISRRGVVEIRFLFSVTIPNFTTTTLDSNIGSGVQRHLYEEGRNLSLEHFVNKTVLKV
jgi:hypothetical protein